MNFRWRLLFGGLVAAAVGGALPHAIAEPFPLEMRLLDAESRSISSDPLTSLFRYVNSQSFHSPIGDAQEAQRAQLEKEFSEVVKKEPEKYNAKHPVRAVVHLGSQRYALVLDSRRADTPVYDRLWFDKNHNGDLTDEESIGATEVDGQGAGYTQSTFPCTRLTIENEGVSVDYAFVLSVFTDASQKEHQYVSASLSAAAFREGLVTLEGKKHHIVVLDFNSNGRFGDEVQVRDDAITVEVRNGKVVKSDPQISTQVGDMLLVDPSRSKVGYAYYCPTANHVAQYLSKLVNIDGAFYEVSVSPSGDQITLAPSPLPLGEVTNSSGPFHTIVYGKHGVVKLSGDGTKPVKLPAGQWNLLAYTIDLTVYPAEGEEAGAEVDSLLRDLVDVLTGSIAGPKQGYTVATANVKTPGKPVQVTKDATVPLPFGPPYKAVVSFDGCQGRTVRLEMSLVGSAGEICQQMSIENQRPGTPQFTITDPEGKVVESGTFRYG